MSGRTKILLTTTKGNQVPENPGRIPARVFFTNRKITPAAESYLPFIFPSIGDS